MTPLLMLKYLLGTLLVQAATVLLVVLAPENLQGTAVLRLVVPVLVLGCVSAFWFASMAHHLRKDHLLREREAFAKERETLRVNAERSKARAMKQAQKDIAREARVTHAKANFKVGAAFAAVIGVGALLLLTQFLTVGIIAVSTAAGALGGYLYRGRQNRNALAAPNDARSIAPPNRAANTSAQLEDKSQ